MKKTRMAMLSAVILAIGSAFVSKPVNDKPDAVGFIQSSTACTSTSTTCDLVSLHACDITVYKTKTANVCSTQLTQKP